MQQQQQSPDYDLLAVFPDEPQATETTEKLHKAGFTADEVHQMASGSIGSGQFREHGPDRGRANYFLQKQHSGPHLGLVTGLALIFALVFGGLTFVSTFAVSSLHVGYIFLIGAVIGLLLGAMTRPTPGWTYAWRYRTKDNCPPAHSQTSASRSQRHRPTLRRSQQRQPQIPCPCHPP